MEVLLEDMGPVKNKTDKSQVFGVDDIFILLENISVIIGVKKPPVSPRLLHLCIQIIDPFHGLNIAYLPQISLGR